MDEDDGNTHLHHSLSNNCNNVIINNTDTVNTVPSHSYCNNIIINNTNTVNTVPNILGIHIVLVFGYDIHHDLNNVPLYHIPTSVENV